MSIRDVKRFILFGDAGAGKSTFINLLYNFCYGSTDPDKVFCEHPHIRLAIPCANWLDCVDNKYKEFDSERDIYDQTQSQTQCCIPYLLQSTKITVELIDTPGFNETSGVQADERNMDQIEKVLKSVSHLNGIILVVNGSMTRLGVSFRNFLHLLQQVCPNDLSDNFLAILTNCDETSVTFPTSVLRESFNVQDNCIFIVQNNLLKWDRKIDSSKTLRRYKENFEDNVQKVAFLLEKLSTFKEVSTQSFKISEIKIGSIEKSIIESIRNMIYLMKCYKEQNIAHDAIKGARTTMDDNRNWEKKQEIHAIFYEDITGHQTVSSGAASTALSSRERSEYVTTTNLRSFDNEQTGQSKSKHASSYHASSPQYVKTHDKEIYTPSTPKVEHMDCDTYDSVNSSTHSSDRNQRNTKSSSYGAQDLHRKGSIADHCSPQNIHHSLSPLGTTNKSVDRRNASTYPSNEPVYRTKEAMIQVTLPDNEARMRYAEAERQAATLNRKTQELEKEQQVLSMKIRSELENLQQKVSKLWSINRNYDILEKHKGLLREFAQTVKLEGDHSAMEKYYYQTVQILTKRI